MDADVIVVGAGLAGLVATAELADAGRRVILLDQEPEASLGGQAFWSFGGLFLVNSAEQRRLRIHDSRELALADWLGSAAFDRAEDHWPRLWAEAYVDFAAGEKRSWLSGMGMKWFPVVQWAERGGYPTGASGAHGNSVPRFHVTWGTGPGVVEPFERQVREAATRGLVDLRFRHRVTSLAAPGEVGGEILAASPARRGEASSRTVAGEFALSAQAVIVTSGGIGGNHDLVRQNWPADWGAPPARMLSGVPAHVDGLMIGITEQAGAHVINADRMWHYPEGVTNWSPIWPQHGIRILSGPSPLWLDANGQPAACSPVPRLRRARRTATRHIGRLRPFVVPARSRHDRHRVRAVRLRAESRPHRQGRTRRARARPGWADRAGAGVSRQGRGLHRPRLASRSGQGDERSRRRRSHRHVCAHRGDPSTRPAGGLRAGQGPAGRGHSPRPAAI